MTGKDLKNSILQLAIQGKLVPQDANDEPASVLLKRIRKEKEQLVKEKSLILSKPEKAVKPIKNYEYEVPGNWTSCQLVDICRAFGRIGFRGYTKNDLVTSPELGAISLSPSNMKETGMVYDLCTYITWEKYDESPEIKIDNGDILIVKTGSSYGKTVLVKELPHKATINPQIAVIKDIKINPLYLQAFLQSPSARSKYEDFVLGTSIPTFSQLNLLSMEIPLPPLKEQQRIVATIEELMPLVDEYDKAQTQLDELNAKLPEALKKSILQEAIMGKLVPQDPKDEPASELLKRIRKEKEQLVKDGKLKKKDLVTTPISDDEKPFEIPESWEWCRLGEIVKNRDSERVPLSVSVRSLQTNKIYDYYGPGGAFDKVESYLFDKRLLLIGEDGANLLTRTKPNAFFAEGKYWVNNHVHVLDSYLEDDIILDYIAMRINGMSLADYVTGTAQPKMNQEKMNSIPIPLPPLSEQRRIVAKLEEILPKIDSIRQ